MFSFGGKQETSQACTFAERYVFRRVQRLAAAMRQRRLRDASHACAKAFGKQRALAVAAATRSAGLQELWLSGSQPHER